MSMQIQNDLHYLPRSLAASLVVLASLMQGNMATAGVSTSVSSSTAVQGDSSAQDANTENTSSPSLVQSSTSYTYDFQQSHYAESPNLSYYGTHYWDYVGGTSSSVSGYATASGYTTLGALHGKAAAQSGVGVPNVVYAPSPNLSAPTTSDLFVNSVATVNGQWADQWAFNYDPMTCNAGSCQVTVNGHFDFSAQMDPTSANGTSMGAYSAQFLFSVAHNPNSNIGTSVTQYIVVEDNVRGTPHFTSSYYGYSFAEQADLGNPEGNHTVNWSVTFGLDDRGSNYYEVTSQLYLEANDGARLVAFGTAAIDSIVLPVNVTMSSLEGALITQQDGSLNYLQPLAPVPEPEHYAMLLTGLVLVGGAAKRRNT